MNFEFHEGFLCSAQELGTNCAMTEKTTCVEGEDEVFTMLMGDEVPPRKRFIQTHAKLATLDI